MHKKCFEEVLSQHDVEEGASPRCPVCSATYNVDINTTFQLTKNIFSCKSLKRLCEMIFYFIYLLFFMLVVSSMYYDLTSHPVVVILFLCCCGKVIYNMYDTILLRIYNSWLFNNSVISINVR